jgi:Fur family transcriptional regulator, stress-responsive regulator
VATGPKELLRERGLRVTAQRLAVLRAVSATPHATADEATETVSGEIGSVSIQAVYDTLGALTDSGLLRRIEPDGSPARYQTPGWGQPHHLVYRVCQRMVDPDCAVGDAPCLTAVEDFGYEIESAEVIYWGRCPECLAAMARRAIEPA